MHFLNSASARNKGMTRKDTFRFFSQNQKKPYVSFALIASQALNIFFDPFITGGSACFWHKKKRPAINSGSSRNPGLIADLTDNIFGRA